MSVHDTSRILLDMALRVRTDERRIGVLSTGERIAVALVLNRPELCDYGTILEAVERLGPEWTKAALMAQRAMPDDDRQDARQAATGR